jgi:hypothetical protein
MNRKEKKHEMLLVFVSNLNAKKVAPKPQRTRPRLIKSLLSFLA